MRMLSLFSGIGGLDLAAHWAGIQTVGFVEIDAYCRRVLAKHWPGVPQFGDIMEVNGEDVRRVCGDVDIICGGFPCQDVSVAGKRAGLAGARSGLWSEYARLIRELQPRWVVVENVPGLLSVDAGGGFGTVLGDLAAPGYDAGWGVWGASDVGAPHRRERVFLVGHADAQRREERDLPSRAVATALRHNQGRGGAGGANAEVAYAARTLPHRGGGAWERGAEPPDGGAGDGSAEPRLGGDTPGLPARLDGRWPAGRGAEQYEWEPPRTQVGVANRAARLKALGNAVVPSQAYPLFAAIMAHEEVHT